MVRLRIDANDVKHVHRTDGLTTFLKEIMNWPPDIFMLKSTKGFKDFEPIFTRYCKMNNFKLEEIQYLYSMINTFCFLNDPNKDKSL